MTLLYDLPIDVIHNLFDSDYVSFKELLQLSSVCKMFNCVAKSNVIWKNKFKKMWPNLAEKFVAVNTDWKEAFKKSYYYKAVLNEKLSEMCVHFLPLETINLSDVECYYTLAEENPYAYDSMMDELERNMDGSNKSNMTVQYYSLRVWRFLKLKKMAEAWKSFVSEPSKISLIKGVCLLSNWFHPFVPDTTTDVHSQVVSIAEKVLTRIKIKYPDHPVTQRGLKTEEVIAESLWRPQECRQILESISHIMFEEMKFNLRNADCYCLDCIFIEKVLVQRKGVGVIIGVIFASIAEMLGVYCCPVNMPKKPTCEYAFLKWDANIKLGPKEEKFIDLANNGVFRDFKYLCDSLPSYPVLYLKCWTEPQALKVFFILAWCVLKFEFTARFRYSIHVFRALKLLNCIKTGEDFIYDTSRTSTVFNFILVQNLAVFQINMPEPIPEDILQMSQLVVLNDVPAVRHKYRNQEEYADVRFAIGMIMKHKRYHYRCLIYSWDPIGNPWWIRKFRIGQDHISVNQPHYRVLLPGDAVQYVAQEDLEIDPENSPILNSRVGKYFQSYHGNYYLPNEAAMSVYPDDNAVREASLQSAITAC